MGLVPVLLALVTMFLWTKVYELFCQLKGAVGPCKAHPSQPRPLPWPPEPEVPPQPAGPATVEFYPVDPLSRGMAERLKGWNMVCLPYQDQDSPYLGNWERSSHTYRRASDSSSSSIVPGLVTGEVPTIDGGEVITIIVILDMIKIILVLITTFCISGGGGDQQDGFKSVACRDLSEVASSEDQSCIGSTRRQDRRLEAGNIVYSQDLGKY